MRPVFLFGAASWCTFLAACAITVFGLDQYEHAWGQWKTFEVEAWVSVLGALVAMGAFGIGCALLHRAHNQASALALGFGCSILFVAACWLLDSIAYAGGVYAALALLIAVSCLAAYAGRASDS